jgi:hypothetical protein
MLAESALTVPPADCSKVGTDRLEETKHTLEKGAKKLHLKQKDHKKRLATEEKERWVPSAIPTAQFNYWVVLPSHLSPVRCTLASHRDFSLNTFQRGGAHRSGRWGCAHC